MLKDRIIVDKAMLPCSFDILLADENFTLEVSHNKKHDILTVALYKDDECICEGEPMIYGSPLFADFYQPDRCPALDIIPWDESGEKNAVTFESFGETVFLTVDNYEESGEVNE